MKASFRQLFRQLLTILCCCLIVTALTGIILGLGDRLIETPQIVKNSLVAVHQGAFLGNKLSPLYVLLIGLGVFILGFKTVIEGSYNLLFELAQPGMVNIYRVIALILVIPLALCVETGVAYRLGTDWFGMPNKQTATFLSVHGGSSLGTFLGIIYILLIGSALVALSALSWQTTKVSNKVSSLEQKNIQQTVSQQFRKTFLANDFAGNKAVKTVTTSPTKIKPGIVIGSIFLLVLPGIIYYLTSTVFVAIASMVIVSGIFVIILGQKSIKGWQYQKATRSKLHEQEAESITMLRAIPDSMLRMSQDGICLSYMPAKEATSFVLYGDIVNKHITEFLTPEIAEQFIESAQLSLKSGSTSICRFSISVDNKDQYHEARITPIGDTEVLILVREIADQALDLAEQPLPTEDLSFVQLFTESELIEKLNTTLKDIAQSQQSHILLCLAIDNLAEDKVDQLEANTDHTWAVNENSLQEIATRIDSFLPSNDIFRLEDSNLVLVISDRNMEEASIMVDYLRRDLTEFLSNWQDRPGVIEFNISLLEINSDSSEAIALVSAVKATCQMAKQKVNFKTFW